MTAHRPPADREATPGEPPVEIVEGRVDAPVFLTCEHASERLPAPWSLPEADTRLAGTHWAYDLGAAAITRALAHALQAPAVLARFSRLLVDANRSETAEHLFRRFADGIAIELNRELDDAEREARLAACHRPYHDTIDRMLAASRAPVIFAIHTFTPLYEGQRRTMEIGILFDREVELADGMADCLRQAGFSVALNEPYSGAGGLLYSIERHAGKHGRRPIELEVRQDLSTDPARRREIVEALACWLPTLSVA